MYGGNEHHLCRRAAFLSRPIRPPPHSVAAPVHDVGRRSVVNPLRNVHNNCFQAQKQRLRSMGGIVPLEQPANSHAAVVATAQQQNVHDIADDFGLRREEWTSNKNGTTDGALPTGSDGGEEILGEHTSRPATVEQQEEEGSAARVRSGLQPPLTDAGLARARPPKETADTIIKAMDLVRLALAEVQDKIWSNAGAVAEGQVGETHGKCV